MRNSANCLRAIVLLSLCVLIAGCTEAPPAAPAASSVRKSSGGPPPPPPGATDVGGANIAAEDLAPEEEVVEREVAAAGVGKKGRNYGGGIVSEPVKQYFQVSQRIQFMNMQQAMKLYKGEFGYFPKSHDVFMEKIIEANGIELPELPEGQRYAYDPARGELMVERPK